MKKLAVIAMLVAIGWYSHSIYGQSGPSFLQDRFANSAADGPVKCITETGEILYGELPQGTVYEKREAAQGSLTIVSDKDFQLLAGRTSTIRGSSGSRCAGRRYCSQMTSCQEAVFFLRHCPGVKMDGDNDGTPCEKQWCG